MPDAGLTPVPPPRVEGRRGWSPSVRRCTGLAESCLGSLATIAMSNRTQVIAAFEATGDYRRVGAELGIPPGQAYLIATGLPADGGDTFPSDQLPPRPGYLPSSTQGLVYPTAEAENPSKKPHVQAWINRLVQSDRPMQEAASARDAAPGEVQDEEATDITTVLTRDHDQVMAMMKQLKTIPGVSDGGDETHQSRRKSIVDMVTVALSKHEAAEQERFWPSVRSLLMEGDEVADQALEQEQKGKDLLHELGDTPASEERFDDLVVELDEASRKHVAFEDKVLLSIRLGMGEEERRQWGRKFVKAEGRAPTRPHPRAPKEPAAAVRAAGAAAAVMDRARDAAGNRPADRRGRAEADLEQEGKG